MSVTGPVDPATGRLYSPPNTGDGLDDLALGDWLAAHTGLPARVDRDTNCALLGEVRAGAARDCRNVVFATFSTGVGGAVLLDGRLLRGRDGVAGEVGHTVVAGDGPLCGCGRRGCLGPWRADRRSPWPGSSRTASESRSWRLLEIRSLSGRSTVPGAA